MDEKARCQSCGQPINIKNFGTNASGSMNFDYCHNCFQKGAFIDPDLTLPQMIQMSIDNMVNHLEINEKEAQKLAHEYVPKLKRWRNNSL